MQHEKPFLQIFEAFFVSIVLHLQRQIDVRQTDGNLRLGGRGDFGQLGIDRQPPALLFERALHRLDDNGIHMCGGVVPVGCVERVPRRAGQIGPVEKLAQHAVDLDIILILLHIGLFDAPRGRFYRFQLVEALLLLVG